MDWSSRATSEFGVRSLNVDALKKLEDLDDGSGDSLMISIIDLYLDISPKTVDKLRVAVKSMDRSTAHDEAHGLKSSSANLGALKLAEFCQSLEDEADPEGGRRTSDLSQLFSQIDREFARVCRDLAVVKCLALGQDVPAKLKAAA